MCPKVPAVRFAWLLACLCRADGAIPKQNAVKVNSGPLGLTIWSKSSRSTVHVTYEMLQVFKGQTSLVNTAHYYHICPTLPNKFA